VAFSLDTQLVVSKTDLMLRIPGPQCTFGWKRAKTATPGTLGQPNDGVTVAKSPLRSKPLNERTRLWLLKNSILLKITEIWGIENVYPNGESRL
jgi:hypothetical protein